jgi:hypothetical protein
MDAAIRKRAWKIRAVVYSALLALAVLVIAARASVPKDPIPLQTLRGTTGQGYDVEMHMGGAHVHSFRIWWIWARCSGRRRPIGTSWSPLIDQDNVVYYENGERFQLIEWPGPRVPHRIEGAFMNGRIYNDGHNVEGTISYSQFGCESGPVRFSASG